MFASLGVAKFRDVLHFPDLSILKRRGGHCCFEMQLRSFESANRNDKSTGFGCADILK
jgi:hypothetical protein